MADPTFEWVDIDRIRPNPWNANVMSDEMFAHAIESIHEFGFVDPVTVRTEAIKGKAKDLADAIVYEVVDGEHRWRAGKEHGRCVRAKDGGWERHGGLAQLPVTNLGILTDAVAKQLTIVLNETRGKYDPKRMGSLLTDLVALKPLPQLLEVLPFSKTEFEQLAELPAVDWDHVSATPSGGKGHRAERWVERVYRLPVVAAEKLDEALREAGDTADAADWERLQALAEHFLRS